MKHYQIAQNFIAMRCINCLPCSKYVCFSGYFESKYLNPIERHFMNNALNFPLCFLNEKKISLKLQLQFLNSDSKIQEYVFWKNGELLFFIYENEKICNNKVLLTAGNIIDEF